MPTLRLLWILGLCGLIACQPASTASHNSETANSNAAASKTPIAGGSIRDLSQDEASGGHILRKHVGQTDGDLRERLRRERNISGASTYTDRAAAERAVGTAIAQSQARIERWLNRGGGHPNLVLDYDSDQPLGRTLNRGDDQPRPCTHAVVVLKYSAPSYYVLTSYPECR